MALPDLSVTCKKPVITISPEELCVTFPGGARNCVQLPQIGVPNALEMARQALSQVNAALTPLTPLFDLIDFAVTIFNCVKLIPDAITSPWKIPEITTCFSDLIKKVDKLLALIPQLSIPLMILGIIDVILAFFEGLVGELAAIVVQLESIAAAATRASELGNAQLQFVVDCASESVDTQIQALNEGLEPLNRLIGVVNALAGLAGLPKIPLVDSLGDDPQAAIVQLQAAIAALQNLRGLIPV